MITIVDYGLGNLGSIKNAFDKLNINSVISSSAKEIEKATGIIFPGVGAAGAGMKNLREMGLDEIIESLIRVEKPLLGICLGMQLFMSFSEEGNVNCLNLINGNVRRFNTKFKVPQTGWNQVKKNRASKLLKGINNNSNFYFVNSYYCDPFDKKIVKGVTEYGQTFCSVFEKKNIFGVQFHPEKSGENGSQLLKNFTDIVYENTTCS
ncbi:imidazole glycerol phosphate synthase, glutamine amidotransferase subunit [Candidatus Roizmanbacteria bacterium RIFCSPHIGHO2_02_FULL_37_13b]|nr:MAG: imidazole glycerol phosphate synthase, glutamine amidotransferase subunit [Candidatus Roizmanbacteria bacterium RIFCSPHIGHO2_02_FULL_37_13b]